MTKTKNARAGAGHTYTGKPMKHIEQRITTAVVFPIIPKGIPGDNNGRPQGGRYAHR